MCHNIRGINSEKKWNYVKNKIGETNCDIICLQQETKKETFDHAYLKNFCQPDLDSFYFIPSIGSSGGSIVIWKQRKLDGHFLFENSYAQSVAFEYRILGDAFILTNIYAPCTPVGKDDFL
jgi:exonuclease III